MKSGSRWSLMMTALLIGGLVFSAGWTLGRGRLIAGELCTSSFQLLVLSHLANGNVAEAQNLLDRYLDCSVALYHRWHATIWHPRDRRDVRGVLEGIASYRSQYPRTQSHVDSEAIDATLSKVLSEAKGKRE